MTNWTDQERELLRVAQSSISDADDLPRMALGATDRGEPWCSIFCPNSGETVVHFVKMRHGYMTMTTGQLAMESKDLRPSVEAFILSWRARKNAAHRG
jgi:hypothetical protein